MFSIIRTGAVMIIIVGLIILIAALIVGVAGVLGNSGSAHAISHFSVLGYHVTGSAGTLFLAGIVVGAVGLFGLTILLAGARRTSQRGSAARRGLRRSRRETAAASKERDDLLDQRDTARANAAGDLTSGTDPPDTQPGPADHRWTRPRYLRRKPAPAATHADWPASRPVPDGPANAPGPVPDATLSPEGDVPAGVSAPAE
jgi:hypothetical protein